MIDYITNFIYSLIRIATPIIFVALSSTISQQAGLLNMAAEAMMLTSALAGVIVSALVQNVWIGILGGVLASVLLALFLCWAAFVLKVDLYLMSISLNMALVGGTVFVVYLLTGTKNTTAGVLQSLALGNVDIPIIKDRIVPRSNLRSNYIDNCRNRLDLVAILDFCIKYISMVFQNLDDPLKRRSVQFMRDFFN